MKGSIPSHNFTLSTVSTSFQSNSSYSDKKESPIYLPKNKIEETRMYGLDKSRSKKDEIPFRNSAKYDKPTTPPSTKYKLQPFLRNTSYFTIQENPVFGTESKVLKADYEQKVQKYITPNFRTCTSIEKSGNSYEKILQKINKKQRLINQLKELSKVSITELIKTPSNEAKQLITKNNILNKQQKITGQHKRGYHSQPNKNKYHESIHNKPVKFDFYRSNVTKNIEQPESPPTTYARQKFKTQLPQQYQYSKINEFRKNPQLERSKVEQFKKLRQSPKPIKIEQSSSQILPLNLVFTKVQSSTQSHKQSGSYTLRNAYEHQNYGAPLTSRNQQSKNIYDIRHISDVKRIKNNVNYFSHKKVQISDFCLLKTLGQGKFGTVHQAIYKPTSSIFAIKKIPKKIIKQNFMIQQLVKQIKLQSMCRHQNILQLYGFFDDKQYIYLVLQYMGSGTLFYELKKNRCFSEEQAAVKLRHVAKAIVYMHQKGIAHRDIKPQNIVIQSGIGKICDFGWATLCEGDRRKTYCGTFDYAAPEILEGTQYDMSVDLWCLGILAYQLLVGKAPFFHFSRKETMKKIINVENETIQYPPHLSKNAISFIERLIKKNPEQRMSGEKILSHPFLLQKTDY